MIIIHFESFNIIILISGRIIIKCTINQNLLHCSQEQLNTVEFKSDFFSFERMTMTKFFFMNYVHATLHLACILQDFCRNFCKNNYKFM